MSNIADRYNRVTQQLRLAERVSHRRPNSVELLAVSKRHTEAEVRGLAKLGQRAFGESYLQEAIPKIASCEELNLIWHFIGNIQKNKTREIANQFDWVHGVDRLILAQRLSAQRPDNLKPLNLCIQVNISDEPEKGGVSANPAALLSLCSAIKQLPRLRLRGLMGMAANTGNPQQQQRSFARLNQLFGELNAANMALDTLSMGMSQDFAAAINEGSTLVRIGTALFGARNSPTDEADPLNSHPTQK